MRVSAQQLVNFCRNAANAVLMSAVTHCTLGR